MATTVVISNAALALLLAVPACTLFVDRNPAQCHSDNECKNFGGHPYCQTKDPTHTNGMRPCDGADDCICVPSKLQPKDCFFGPPGPGDMDPKHFLNQCSLGYLPSDPGSPSPLGQCLSYNNDAINPDAGLIPPPPVPPAPPSDAGVPVPAVFCKDLAPGGTVLYMSGSSNFPPLLQEVAPAIAKSLAIQGFDITVVFKTTTSCAGVQSVYPVQPATVPPTYYPARTIHDPTSAADSYPQYFDPTTGRLAPCRLGPAGATVDIGESEIFAETCANPNMSTVNMTRNADDVAETQGPKLAILFVAPVATDQRDISSEAARQVFGTGNLDPWTRPGFLYIRGAGTATQQLIAHQIGVPSNKFWGIDLGTAEALASNLGSVTVAADAKQAIGILGADFYDRNRIALKALAFRATDQECAYTPDSNSNSTLTAKDKINVRDGHYPIWGSVHLFNVKAGGGSPLAVTAFTGLFGAALLPPEMLDAFIDASFVPNCAMMVERDTELGPMRSAVPAVSCGCHFDSRVNVNSTATSMFVPPGCTVCGDDSSKCIDPKKPQCIYGFCEVASQ